MHIDIYSDTICPWCYIGKRRLERALSARTDIKPTIRWRAFQLNPWMPENGMSRGEYLTAKFGSDDAGRVYDNIRRVGETEGLDFRFDLIPRTPNTVMSHRLISHATKSDRQDSVMEALFSAYFLEGRDIGDMETVAGIAGTAGLDRDEVLRFLQSGEGADDIRKEDAAAREMGIQGVPCFIIDGSYAISGAQEPEYFFPLFDLGANNARTLQDAHA